jgi:hypothetical protein
MCEWFCLKYTCKCFCQTPHGWHKNIFTCILNRTIHTCGALNERYWHVTDTELTRCWYGTDTSLIRNSRHWYGTDTSLVRNWHDADTELTRHWYGTDTTLIRNWHVTDKCASTSVLCLRLSSLHQRLQTTLLSTRYRTVSRSVCQLHLHICTRHCLCQTLSYFAAILSSLLSLLLVCSWLLKPLVCSSTSAFASYVHCVSMDP